MVWIRFLAFLWLFSTFFHFNKRGVIKTTPISRKYLFFKTNRPKYTFPFEFKSEARSNYFIWISSFKSTDYSNEFEVVIDWKENRVYYNNKERNDVYKEILAIKCLLQTCWCDHELEKISLSINTSQTPGHHSALNKNLFNWIIITFFIRNCIYYKLRQYGTIKCNQMSVWNT